MLNLRQKHSAPASVKPAQTTDDVTLSDASPGDSVQRVKGKIEKMG